MASRETTELRRFRTTKDLWERFTAAVANSPDPEADMSKALRAFVRWYVHERGAQLPDRPPAGPWSKPGASGGDGTAKETDQ